MACNTSCRAAKNRLRAELDGFAYLNSEVRELTLQLLAKTERDLQVGFGRHANAPARSSGRLER